ncbi:MAG: hypothetical protein MUC28_04545 [Planctomycetes bacterium]|nr:hypothetical protein [Planctomycetota bacterium]
MEFIGLDTGSDFLPDYELGDAKDGGPEGNGLSDMQISALAALDTNTPKVVMTHHPVMNGANDSCSGIECPAQFAEDGSFVFNHRQFPGLATSSQVGLVLSGHTHNTRTYDLNDQPQNENTAGRPLFLQTPSATKDGNIGHGYRLIDAVDGAVNPRAAQASGAYEKTVAQMSGGENLELRAHDPDQPTLYVSPKDETGFSSPFFAAAGTNRLIIYATGSHALYSVANNGTESDDYDLSIRREEILDLPEAGRKRAGYAISETTASILKPFVSFFVDRANKLAKLDFEDLEIESGLTDEFRLEWPAIFTSAGEAGIIFKNEGSSANFTRLPASLTAGLASPAEIRLVDELGRRTGQINGEIREEIPLALYETEFESATAYFEVNELERPLWVEVKGLPDIFDLADDEFGLTVNLDRLDKDSLEFRAVNIPITASTTFRFRFDWEMLASGGEGTTVEIDNNHDGVFESEFAAGCAVTARDVNSHNPRKIKVEAIAKLNSIEANNKYLEAGLDKAAQLIGKSLEKAYWADDFHLELEKGDKVFQYERLAASVLSVEIIVDLAVKRISLPAGAMEIIREVLDDLVKADRLLAQAAYREAAVGGLSAKELQQIERKLKQGEDARLALVAINHYLQAWKMAGD